MATPTLIGVAEPRGAYTARHLTYGDHPDILVPLLRRIWTQTFTRDTTTMTAALLAHDWYALATNPRRLPADRQPPVAGVGYPTPAGDDTRHGRLGEDLDGFLEWLYLLHPGQRLVAVYEATCHARWLRHSLHHLDPAAELFVTEPDPHTDDRRPVTVCTVCGAVDQTRHEELPSMAGYGHDTATTCERCGSTVTTDPMFGAHITRQPWPPHSGTPGEDNTL